MKNWNDDIRHISVKKIYNKVEERHEDRLSWSMRMGKLQKLENLKKMI
jgi:hypothetical protein